MTRHDKNLATECLICNTACQRHSTRYRNIYDLDGERQIEYFVYYCDKCKKYFTKCNVTIFGSKYSVRVIKAVINLRKQGDMKLEDIRQFFRKTSGFEIPVTTIATWCDRLHRSKYLKEIEKHEALYNGQLC